MKYGKTDEVFFDEITRLLFCIHRAYCLGFITRSGMTEICEFLDIQKKG
jgi:hypothetical protein